MSLQKSDWLATCVLIIIAAMSIFSWGVMGYKWFLFRNARRENEAFLNVWDSNSGDLTAIHQQGADYLQSPNAKVFAEGYRELRGLTRVVEQRPLITHDTVTAVERSIDRVVAREILRMERYMIALATTANAAPLLGLLGTVWGVLVAFWEIGMRHDASAATVAPGISTALITTVAGLIAAIPAVLGYNYFHNRANQIVLEMEDFSSRFISLLERNIRRDVPQPETTKVR